MDAQTKKHDRLLCFLINLFWFVIIFFLTHITPVAGDDIVLAHIFGTDQPIRTAHDFFSSIWIHQMTWGGNLVGWGICQIYALAPRIFFELCNGLVWVGGANLICRFARSALGQEAEGGALLLCLVHLALWFFVPSLYEILWLNAGIEYLWFNFLTLLFFYCLLKASSSLSAQTLPPAKRAAFCAAFFLFGLLVNLCVKPATAATLAAALPVGALWAYLRKDRLNLPLLAAAFLGVAIGFFLSSFSPGHAARSALVAERTPYTASIVFRIARTFFHGCRHSLVPLGLTGFFVVLNRSRRSWLELDELFFIFLAFVNVAVMAMPNGYSPRTVLLSSLLLVIALARSGLRLVSESPACQQARPQLRKALWVLILFLTLYALLQVSIGVLMHYRQGTTFERETLYFLVKYDIFK